MKNKKIIVIPGASKEQIELFEKKLKDKETEIILINKDIQIYIEIDGELVEVVSTLIA